MITVWQDASKEVWITEYRMKLFPEYWIEEGQPFYNFVSELAAFHMNNQFIKFLSLTDDNI